MSDGGAARTAAALPRPGAGVARALPQLGAASRRISAGHSTPGDDRMMPRLFPRAPLLVALLAVATSPPAPRAASLEPATWRGDVRVLVSAVDSLHPRPPRGPHRAAWDSAAAELERTLPTMRYDQAVAGFSRLLAMLRDGHSRLGHMQLPSHSRPALIALPGPGFTELYPLDFEVFADGLRVTRVRAEHEALLGAHVVAIAGIPTERAVERLSPLISADNPLWTLHALPAFLRTPGYLSAAGLVSSPTAPLVLTLQDSRGKRRDVRVPLGMRDSTAAWIAADAQVREPLPLTRRLTGPLSFTDLGDSARTVFVRIRAIVNEPERETFAQAVSRLFAHVDSVGARRLILDLRGNGGGNNYLNQPLVHALIRRPALDREGHLFVIVDRGTFSAAVSLAADLQRETHALFVGEPTGGAPNSPGDPARIRLPASDLLVRISTVQWNGSDPRDPRAFIAPDLPARPTWADWMARRDPALAAIQAYRADGPADDSPPNTHWGNPKRLEATVPRVAW